MIQYKVKVHPKKSPVFLWGSDDIEQAFNGSLTFVMKNDEVGETVVIETLDEKSNARKAVAELRPGESCALQIGTRTRLSYAAIGSILGVLRACGSLRLF